MSSSNNWLLTLKIVLISTGVVSIAVALKLSLPVAADVVASQVPSLWSSLLSWLRPPYLYLIINCIIISIVASSRLHTSTSTPKSEDHHRHSEAIPPPPDMAIPPLKLAAAEVSPDFSLYNDVVMTEYGYESNVLPPPKVSDPYADAAAAEETEEVLVAEPEEEEEISKVLAEVNGGDDVTAAVASRHARGSPEGGKSLGVSKPKRHDTLESTWKTITDGRSVPLTRHLKKADTWERRMDQNTPPLASTAQQQQQPYNKTMHKSETFHERSTTTATGSPVSQGSAGRLRKEPSLSQDELNRRVEAFINKFNEEMRLQRQESLNQYQEMVGRGAQTAPLAH